MHTTIVLLSLVVILTASGCRSISGKNTEKEDSLQHHQGLGEGSNPSSLDEETIEVRSDSGNYEI
jgi:hypothetical protein